MSFLITLCCYKNTFLLDVLAQAVAQEEQACIGV